MSTYKELAGLKIKTVTSDPSNPLLGEMWYNSTTGSLKVRTFSPGSWTSANSAGGSYMTFAGCGTKAAYVKTMGNDGTPGPNPFGNDTKEYDGTNWTSGSNCPYSSRDPGGAGIQTAALFFGGQGSPATLNTSVSYDGSSFSGTPSMGNPRRSCNGGGTSTAAITVGGAGPASGSPEGAMTNVEHYNGSSWSEEATIPVASRGCTIIGSEPAALYIGGVSPASTATYEYDGSSWTTGGTANTARATQNAGGAGTQTAGLVYGGGPSVSAVESYDGTSFTSDSTLGSGTNGQGNANPTPYSAPTTALYVGNPNPPDSFPASMTVEEYSVAAAATQTVAVT